MLAAAIVVSIGATSTLSAQCAPAVQREINLRLFDAAKTAIEKQLAQAPASDAAMGCMGRLLLEQNDGSGAADWQEKAVAANRVSALHHQNLGLALRLKANQGIQLTQAPTMMKMKEELELAASMDATLVDARATLIALWLSAGEAMGGGPATARPIAEAIMKVNPVRGHMAFGGIAEDEKKFDVSEKEFLAAIAARPDSEVAYSAAGGFYRRRERFQDAVAMYDKQLTLMPKDGPLSRVSLAHYNLGLSHQGLGHLDRAKSEFQAALAANPDNTNANQALAKLP